MALPLNAAGYPEIQFLALSAREQLVAVLKALPGIKDLILDGELMRPLDRFAGAKILKENGVDKIYKMDQARSQGINDQRIYLVRPRLCTIKWIAEHINSDKSTGKKRRYKIVMVPRKLHTCELILEQKGVHGDVILEEFPLDLIPLDRDILSLELPEFYTSYFLDGDQTWCHTVAKSIVSIQQTFGPITNVYTFGSCAKMAHKMTDLLFEYHGAPKQVHGQIGHMFLIGRDVDYVTPLCSQVAYEGLLDDVFGINAGMIELGPEVTGKDTNMKLLLVSSDDVYEEIRNRHFSNVFAFLSAKAKELQSGYDKRHDMSIGQMKDYVANELKGLKQQHKSLATHISACEVIMKRKTKGEFEEELRTEHSLLEGVGSRASLDSIEEMIHRQKNIWNTLRLLCLMSLTQDGLPSATYRSLKTQFLHSHGFEYLTTFHNLKRLGLLTEKDPPAVGRASSAKPLGKVTAAVAQLPKVTAAMAHLQPKSQFRALSKRLNLIPKSAENIDLRNPGDMSYVFSGAYTPLSCKLVEQVLLKESFIGMEDVIKLMPGPCHADLKGKSARGRTNGSTDGSKTVLVYFLGGCTYSEVAALRFLGKQRGYKIIVATTNTINGQSLVRQVADV